MGWDLKFWICFALVRTQCYGLSCCVSFILVLNSIICGIVLYCETWVPIMLVRLILVYAILSTLTLVHVMLYSYIVTCTGYNCEIYRRSDNLYLYAFAFKCKCCCAHK
jgi:hypothetical protein